jgi:hypothetical protein
VGTPHKPERALGADVCGKELVEGRADERTHPSQLRWRDGLCPWDLARAALAEGATSRCGEPQRRWVPTGNAMVKLWPPALVRKHLEDVCGNRKVEVCLVSRLFQRPKRTRQQRVDKGILGVLETM